MNNYQLYLFDHTIPDGTFKYLQDAIETGKACDTAFTVQLVEPNMIVCFWQPGQSEVAYNETYKRWYVDQQKALHQVHRGVMG